MEVLAPLMEGPMGEDAEENRARIERKEGWGRWMKGQLSRGTSSSSEIFNAVGLENAAHKRSDLRLLLGVMGAPLSPVGVFSLPDLLPRLCIKDTPIVCTLLFITSSSNHLSMFRPSLICAFSGVFFRSVHSAAVSGGNRRAEATEIIQECICHGKSEDGCVRI